MSKRVALYVRVSTGDQTVANQIRDLEAVASAKGWQVAKVFQDDGVSGAKGRDKRPGFDALWKAVTRREVDMVAAWSVDRLGRSLQDLAAFLAELHACDVNLYLHRQGIDTTTPAGRAMFQMMGVFAEFERAIIQERVKAGMARARAEGKHLGRPPLPAKDRAAVLKCLGDGKGVRETARLVGVSPSAVRTIRDGATPNG